MQPLVKLHDYQITAKNFIMQHPKCGLFLDVGFGKTIITLSAIQDLCLQGQISGHILIVAPKAVAMSTWPSEMEKWGMHPNCVSLILNEKGKQLTKAKRWDLYAGIENHVPSFYFINRELLFDLIDWHKQNRKTWPFQTVVIDELQAFKSHSSKRFKALKSVCDSIKRFIGLTGTPQPNGLMDLWSTIYLMDSGQRLGRTITEYRNTYFNPGLYANGYPVTWRARAGADKIIYDKIKDIVISIKNPDLKLPAVTEHNVYCYMLPDELALYKSFVKEKIITSADAQGNEITATAVNNGVLVNKMKQMASGTLYIDDSPTKDYMLIHNQKLEMLQYIIENTGSPVLVAYYFNSDLSEIKKRLTSMHIEPVILDGSIAMQDDWNAGKIPVMLMHPASMGAGLNLQFGGHTLVWYTLPASLEHYIQTNGRLARQGQPNPVMIHYLLTKQTYDEKQIVNLYNKDFSEKACMDAVAAAIDICA